MSEQSKDVKLIKNGNKGDVPLQKPPLNKVPQKDDNQKKPKKE